MLYTSIVYITENTMGNRRNLKECLAVYSTENKTKQKKSLTWKPTNIVNKTR